MKKNLIIDDDAQVREMLTVFLNKDGYNVETAKNGEIGLNVFYEFKPEVLLLDLKMPKKDGFQVLVE